MVTDSTGLVVLSQRLGAPGPHEARLEDAGARVQSVALFTSDQIAAGAGDADVVILGAVEPFDAAALAALPNLRAVVRRGVGHDNVDVEAATRLGIVVANVPDASVEEVSDHALGMLLALERNVARLDRAIRQGRWQEDPAGVQQIRVSSRRLSDLTLGVVGFGRIGRALVRKARSVYPEIIVTDPAADEAAVSAAGAQLVGLHPLLQRADHVSLHVPMASSNRHLIGADELAEMRAGAVLVNTARGGLVDEAAAVAAVRSGHIRGVGLDVTAQEPLPADAAVFTVEDNVLLTGHAAAWSETAANDLAAGSVDAVEALLAGRLPRSLVNPEVLRSPMLRIRELTVAAH
ncbi:MAG TPA: NAD(P)-dependent oxidoreductase [Microbacterium sp.]|nr:NAD(P)-dependent oxidoreductase [Microbacterium sp.]